ncbi:unnamed protein product, partial [Tilletia caries]
MLGALDIVEGNEPQPVAIKIEESTTAALTIVSAEEKKNLKFWLERDRKAMAIMRRTISDALKVDIEDCRSAKEIWDQLCSLHDLTAPEHRAEIKRELLNHFLLEGTDLKAHLDGFLRMLYKASGAGLRYADEDKCLMFLDTLPESFDMLKFQWRMYPESLKTFAELRRHMKRDCPKDEDSQEDGDTHMVAPTEPFIGVANAVTVDPAEDATVATVTGPRSTTWIIDSGATHHIVSDASQLTDMRHLHSPMQFGLATRKGSMESTVVGCAGTMTEDGKKVIFTDVHHVKEARVNLLSAPVLIRKGWTVSLKHNASFIRNGTLTLSLAEKQGLFLLELPGAGTDMHQDQHLVAFTPAKDEVVTLTEAHERFGHMSKTRLKNMIRDGTIKGIVLKDNVSDFCVSCQKVKTTKHTFGQETLRGTSPLYLVVTDVAGAVQGSVSGNKYYVALTDDYLGLTLAKAIPAKHVVAQTLIGWINLLENCLAAKVHVLRSDSGGEYTSNAFKAWLGGKGIVNQITPPYTPQHNGIAERKNRKIKEMVSAMMVDSGISMAYWDWALQYTTVIQLILTVRDGISAWKRLFKRKVNLRMVQPFGCAAWVHTPAETRTKSDLTAAKTIRGRYLGLTYEGGVAVLENGTEKIHVTREDGPVPTPASTTVEEPHLHDVAGSTDESSVGQGEDVEKVDEGRAEQGEDAAKVAKEAEGVLQTGVGEPVGEPKVADVEGKGTAVAEDQGEQEAKVDQQDVPGDRNEDTRPADRKRAREDEVAVGTGQARARPMHVPEPRRPRPEVPRRALPPRRAAPGRNGNVNIAAAELGDEPNTHRQAMAAPDASEWQATEAVELGNHRRAGTWEPAKLPVGRTAVGSRWVYKRKMNSE